MESVARGYARRDIIPSTASISRFRIKWPEQCRSSAQPPLEKFYDPGRGDVILNLFDPRAARWDLFGEIATLFDADQLCRSLIADTEGAESSLDLTRFGGQCLTSLSIL